MNESNLAKEMVIQLAEKRRDKSIEKRGLIVIKEPPKYVIYVRRSTKKVKNGKSPDKQERSIADQLRECKEFAEKYDLPYKESEIITEEETSHKSEMRSGFTRMLENIKNRKYNSIIAWHPDRLARNMKEAGMLIDMLDKYQILDLKFPSYSFNNDPSGKMALGIQFVLAKQYSDSISVNTKRGLEGAVLEGKYTGKIKLGYESDASKYFRVKKGEFEAIRRTWDLALRGYTLAMMVGYLNGQGIKIDNKRLGNLFHDSFYAGILVYGPNVVDLRSVDPSFTPMVTSEEYIKVRELLDKRKFYKTKTKNTFFVQLVKCDGCGRFMTVGASKARNKSLHLYLNCMNKNCPIILDSKKANRVRGAIIKETMQNLLKHSMYVTKEIYQNALKSYNGYCEQNLLVVAKEVRVQEKLLQNIKDQISAKESMVVGISDSRAKRKIQEEVGELYKKQVDIEDGIGTLMSRKGKIECDQALPVMSYDEFLNHCKDLHNKVENTTSPELLDEIVRTLVLNLTIRDKKVWKLELQEPYSTYKFMGTIQNGVADGA